MVCLVPEPNDRVDAMDDITNNQPKDDRCRGDAVMMILRWKNQEEEKSREEGKNGELDTHGAGKSLRVPALKTRRKGSVRALNTQVRRVTGKIPENNTKSHGC
jgi:hypothetical protein